MLNKTTSAATDGGIHTRGQLLAAINAWLKKHDQPEWTIDELIGRSVEEAYVFSPHDNGILSPVESFLVGLIKDRPFTRTIELRVAHIDSIKLTSFKRRHALPPHYSLGVEILAKPADLMSEHENLGGADHWRIALATVLEGQEPKTPVLANGKRAIHGSVATPKQLLDSINGWRRKYHRRELTLNEVASRVADEAFAVNDFGWPTGPDYESFMECLLKNKPFAWPMRISQFEPGVFDEMTAPSTRERLRLPRHDALAIDILCAPLGAKDSDGIDVYIDYARVFVSYYFPTKRKTAEARKPP